ncbi:MAG: FAD-binding oxidoreductase [Lutibacter sp.]|jgi:alkyldihydroxyacetonephosphate synthase
MNNQTWWKWGDPDKSFHLNSYPKLRNFLEHTWNKKLIDDFRPTFIFEKIAKETFSVNQFKDIFPNLKLNQFSNTKNERLKFALGKSYFDVIRVFTDDVVSAPDFVLSPNTEGEVYYILQQCEIHGISVITFSGGSNVTGAFNHKKQGVTCTLNLRKLNRLLEIDTVSNTATFEAGIMGPELEKLLNEKGFTLGHFPQSFEYSALGGWIATRSAGQESGLYGKIEDMVLGLTVVAPRGIITNEDYPKHASGIDIHPLFMGSEGTLGVITKAKVKISTIPKKYKWIVAIFKDFNMGTKAVQELVQAGVHPAICRLSDPMETKMLSFFSRSENTGIKKIIQDFYKKRLKSQGFGEPSILMLRFAIKNEADEAIVKMAKKIIKTFDSKLLPSNISADWESNRFSLPYLRDTLIEHRVLIDTFETVAYWKNLTPLYNSVSVALKATSNFFDKGGILFCHISHSYETGASLYFTIIAPQELDNEVAQWKKIKSVVSEAIITNNGAISHHHGVGKDHKKWYLQKLGIESRLLLQAIKAHLDPKDILNPGSLFDEVKEIKQD